MLFRGRASGVVNVGGANVWPETVEAVLRRHPDVIEAVVSSKPNSMMGNVLVAQVTVTADADARAPPRRFAAGFANRRRGLTFPHRSTSSTNSTSRQPERSLR